MRYQFDQIAAFLQAVDSGSISGAAERLNLAKSVVSKRIADLERSLGVGLVHRSARGVVPTDRGRFFYSNARALLRELDNAIEEMAETGELSGVLRVTVPMSCAAALRIGELLFEFASLHSRLEMTLDFNDNLVDLSREGYDLAVRISRYQDPSMVSRKLAVLPRVLCCSPAYGEECGLPESLGDLAKHACIVYGRSNALWELEDEDGKPRSIPVRSRIVTNNTEAMRDAALAGLGIALLPLFMAEAALRGGRLIRILSEVKPAPDIVHALYPRMRRPSRKVASLVDFLGEAFKRRAWEEQAIEQRAQPVPPARAAHERR